VGPVHVAGPTERGVGLDSSHTAGRCAAATELEVVIWSRRGSMSWEILTERISEKGLGGDCLRPISRLDANAFDPRIRRFSQC